MKPTTYLLAALVSLAASLCGQPPAQLLENPGFEQRGRTPRAWSFNHRGTDGELAWDRSRVLPLTPR